MESLIKQGHCAYCKTEIRDILSQGPHPKTKAKYCPNCGAQVRYEDRFCPKCGESNPIYLGNDPDYFAELTKEE